MLHFHAQITLHVSIPLLYFCHLTAPKCKIVLTGECADELFCGYPWYHKEEFYHSNTFPWTKDISPRLLLLKDDFIKKLDIPAYIEHAYQTSCSEFLPDDELSEEMALHQKTYFLTVRWFMQTLLDRKDRMSMYSGLEVRVPFCDYRIAEYLYGAPWEFKDYKGREKGLLRHAVQALLPEEIIHRKKSPYPKTFDPHYEELIAERLKGVLEEKENPLFCLLDRQHLLSFLTQEMQWPWYGQLMRRPQTMAYLLQIEFWLRRYRVDFRF